MDFRGRTALITGASSGIGAAFARELASRGADVVLVARRQDRLVSLAAELEGDHGITAHVVPIDLSTEGAAVAIRQATDAFGVRIDTLVSNAGFGTYGPYETIDPQLDHKLAMVQVVAIVDLTHAYLPDMVAAADGVVINVASGASFQPMPYQAVYGAVKALLLVQRRVVVRESQTLCPLRGLLPRGRRHRILRRARERRGSTVRTASSRGGRGARHPARAGPRPAGRVGRLALEADGVIAQDASARHRRQDCRKHGRREDGSIR